mmetsp:Transcript_8627/g.18413  ORF Transcript_8627/g.18413 Transcript_8627/m.18413 type:complete len:399 (+) Transcript_8627:182-1378(+)
MSWGRRAADGGVVFRGIDRVVGSLTSAFGRAMFFSHGWGDCDAWMSYIINWKSDIVSKCRSSSNANICSSSIHTDLDHDLEISWSPAPIRRLLPRSTPAFFREGSFISPVAKQMSPHLNSNSSSLPLSLPKECFTARFVLASPTETLHSSTPFVVLLAGTGEQAYSRRLRSIAEPLLKDGVGAIILENAYYGRRKPRGQFGSKLHRVSDLLALGHSTVEEATMLLRWLYRNGCERLCVSGMSQGGLHAAMAASLLPHPVAVVPAFAPESASFVFTRGVLGRNCDWNKLSLDLPHCSSGTPPSSTSKAQTPMQQMERVLELTDIRSFPPPQHPQRAVIIAAHYDQYVSPVCADIWRQHWPWAEVRWVHAGHVTGILCHAHAVCNAIRDALQSKNLVSSI